jgi:hypothetical protein
MPTEEVHKTGNTKPGTDGVNLSGGTKNVSESKKSELKSFELNEEVEGQVRPGY